MSELETVSSILSSIHSIGSQRDSAISERDFYKSECRRLQNLNDKLTTALVDARSAQQAKGTP